MNQGAELFHEEQRFSRMFLGVVAAALALPTGILGYAFLQQVVLGQPWGRQPMSNTALTGAIALALGFDAVIITMYLASRLVTVVRRDGFFIRFSPFHWRFQRISLDEVVHCEARTYRPLAEYGGWGIRWVPGGKAYNPCGNQGVRLEFASGEHLLIGSQRPEELARAILRLRRGRIDEG